MEFTFADSRVAITVPDRAALEDAVAARLAAGQGFALATLNLDHLVKLTHSPAFRRAYAAHDLVTADGNPVVWLSRLAGRPVSLVTGADAIVPLVRVAARQGVPVALVGSTPRVLEAAAAHLTRTAPGLDVALTIAPPMGFDAEGPEAEAVLDRIAASGARLCFVAMGAPRQEQFAALGRGRAPHIGLAGIGAGLDFFAGTQRRAPRWVRRLALEWLWRMGSSPARLVPRYARCAAILPGLALRALALRRAR